ncbi:hypothetical protein HZH68_003801 [Vespula germanica]|uniref:Uncharacterized protein n=1 Tax=Vespula germanica TaxID=30212 RepID=A0A834KMJ8_VESGE|nr:hypothetical protein HZH68_003801 [Vespula germanica]
MAIATVESSFSLTKEEEESRGEEMKERELKEEHHGNVNSNDFAFSRGGGSLINSSNSLLLDLISPDSKQ